MSDTPKNYCNCPQCQTVDCHAGRELAAMELRCMDYVALNERQAVNFAKCQAELAASQQENVRLREALTPLLPGYEQYIEWAAERNVFGLEYPRKNLDRARAASHLSPEAGTNAAPQAGTSGSSTSGITPS